MRRFFRYSISHSDDIVSLGKELNNIKRYFVIQGYRFSKRFSLVVDISEDDIAIWGISYPKTDDTAIGRECGIPWA